MFSMSFPFAFFFCFYFFLSTVYAFDINKILSDYSDFTNFNNLLTQSGLAKEINNKQSVTVLVVSNGNTAALSGQSKDIINKVLSVHVILDYYDEKKLKISQSKKPKILTTLYQQSGKALNQLGFLNMTNTGKDTVVFESASPGSNLDSKLVKQVTAKPYNISVLEVSNIINIAQDIANSPSDAPKASHPRKVLTPGLNPSDDDEDAESPAPSKSKTKRDKKKLADAPASKSADDESSALSVLSRDYLPSAILMILTWAWLLLTMV